MRGKACLRAKMPDKLPLQARFQKLLYALNDTFWVVAGAERDVSSPSDLKEIRNRHACFDRIRLHGPVVGLFETDP